ncbi:unnamed protein product [Lupinus luteus]|uniref:DUF4094 domain-containing protein n=1 Tax=Lupinus luteus TaxID=3873 RepID=A0AAV1W167_LUPLU
MHIKSKGGASELSARSVIPRKWALLLCIGSFYAEMFFTNRMWSMPECKEISRTSSEVEKIKLNPEGCNLNLVVKTNTNYGRMDVSNSQNDIKKASKTTFTSELNLKFALVCC